MNNIFVTGMNNKERGEKGLGIGRLSLYLSLLFLFFASNLCAQPTEIQSLSQITNTNGSYRLSADIEATNGTGLENFSGTLDGNYHKITGLTQPLFISLNGGTVKNLILDDVTISSGTDVGAIAGSATGASKIYNCGVLGGSVSGTGSVGGLIGTISGDVKVVNNYNYAAVNGGNNAAGVVGYVDPNLSAVPTSGYVRFKLSGTDLYMTDHNRTLLIRTDGDYGYPTFQQWILEPSGGGYKIKSVGEPMLSENVYIANSGSWDATFNTTGSVYTIVPITEGNYSNIYIQRADGRRLGTNGTNDQDAIYTNKTGTTRTQWVMTAIDAGFMVANCINYGTTVTGTRTYPVYGGSDLDNKQNPLYDFFLYNGADYREDITSTNGALPAEERFLNRFEYIRATLNAERKLAAYYLFGNYNATSTAEIGKWVLDTTIAPYPVIKPWGKYPSLTNPDYSNRTVGTLSVTISNNGNTNITLPISDQNEQEFDYGYHKVQLPYYNDYYNNNYQANKVVTGWKITNVTGGTAGSFTTSGNDAYNFADRNCTNKDLFSVSGRIFAQGGFYYVPEGVTAITIEPYWANDVVYAYDPNLDKVFGMGYSESNFGPEYTPSFTPPTGAKTATSLRAANKLLTNNTTNVYDHAIVLIGNINFRRNGQPFEDYTRAYTLMSIDEDKDNEPDYCEFYGHVHMRDIPPTRLDFVYQVGISWVKKPMGETLQSYSGIAMTTGHFEITETAFARFTEFETGNSSNYSAPAPLIFNGGLLDQFVMDRDHATNKVNYAILGGHTFFNAYTPGCHATNVQKTTFFPVSVMGGEYPEFYLTGRNSKVTVDANNHGRVYTNGGKIGTFASGYWEQLNGNAYIRFDHTTVKEFYGGSINPAKPITGNIDIIINNCDVEFFCGGPKAGNMTSGKTVTTVANNSTFGTYVGAGYGGSSVARVEMKQNVDNHDYAYYKSNFFSSYFHGGTNATYLKYNSDADGILIRYAVEFMPGSGGMGNTMAPTHVTRFFNEYAQLNLARTYTVTSTLNGCTITGNFYGGPWSGTVGTVTATTHPTVTSTLNDCTVMGSVFGGGKSAEIPTITVFPASADSLKTPLYSGQFGMYYQEDEDDFPVYPTGTQYNWVQITGTSNPQGNATNHTLQTKVDLTNLGTIFGHTDLTINGGIVHGSVFGGGDQSKVSANTHVTIKGTTHVKGNVYGGGNAALVGGNTHVDIGGE